MPEQVCVECGKTFNSPTQRKTCSTECHHKLIWRTRACQPQRFTYDATKLSASALAAMHQYNNVHDDSSWKLVANILDEIGQSYILDYEIDGVVYDIYIPATQTVICVDATVNNVAFRDVVDSIYIHRNDGWLKSTHAVEHGYRCIHWYDWDDVFKLPMVLATPKPVYARECTVAELPSAEAQSFLKMYHLQGSRKGVKAAYGLYHRGALLQVMTFGKPLMNKQHEWEMFRLCSDPAYRVVGGASKLFRHFIAEHNPESIITYCDVAKFSGAVYSKLGMTFRSYTSPTIIWSRGTEQMPTNTVTRFGFDALFKTNYGKSINTNELMIMSGWLPVYNCGQSSYTWQRSTHLK